VGQTKSRRRVWPTRILTPFELTDAELDAVSGGLAVGDVGQVGGLNLAVTALNGNQVTISNLLNNNTVTVGIGAAVALLGAAGATGLLHRLA
jgi:hypothetical protein